MKNVLISNMSETRSIKVSEDMDGWITEFNNAAKLIVASYRDESLGVGYKVRSEVLEGLCGKLEHILKNLTGDRFLVMYDQSETDNVLSIELRK